MDALTRVALGAGAVVDRIIEERPHAPTRTPPPTRRFPRLATTSRSICRVALIYDARRIYDIKVMTGVAAYLREHDRCSVLIEGNALQGHWPPDLLSLESDGIIAGVDDPAVAKAVVRSGIPAVGFGGGYEWLGTTSPMPYFSSNSQSIGVMAATHLLQRGFKHFGFCGYAPNPVNGWSAERERAFVNHVRDRGLAVTALNPTRAISTTWTDLQRVLIDWLRALPKPVGIMTANDHRGQEVLEACRACDLRVPGDVAVIGVDNDELLCQLSRPALSSVDQGATKLGYAAASMLDRLIDGERPDRLRCVVDPAGVIQRMSTEALAITDPDVAKAMVFIRAHSSAAISVRDVVRATAVSRSTLEGRFRPVLQCTIREAVRRAHLEHARHLIIDTGLPLKQIAPQSGFRTVQHMTTCFLKAFGTTPGRYRRSHA